ncbi:unnamed protein product [Peniophora sp. CBMAI 1063]|nr:unnamed protein product [Peniophora sp. CBMAI 1063]
MSDSVGLYYSTPVSVALASRSGTDDSGTTPLEEYVPQPYEDWASTPSRTPISPPPGRGRSIKALVQRFEELDASEDIRVSRPSDDGTGLYAPFFKQPRKTSPLRQSIRNFVSVFKKAKRERDEPVATPYSVVEEYPMPNEAPGSAFCASPPTSGALQSGIVLHLSTPNGSSAILPVWTQYHAELHAKHLLLSSDTAYGLPVSKVLSLSGCRDVYSVSSREMRAEEQALMPALGSTGSPVVFDLAFDGKVERFAVDTAKERATWVHTILTSVLRSPIDAFTPPGDIEAHRPVLWIETTAHLTSGLAQESLGVEAPAQPSSLLRRERVQRTERNLPPLPLQSPASAAGGSQCDRPTDAQHVPVAQLVMPESPFSSPTKVPISPSVVNLSRQSVVRRRLAEMEQQVSSTSQPFSATSASATSASDYTASPMSPHMGTQLRLDSGYQSKGDCGSPSQSGLRSGPRMSVSPASDVIVPTSPFKKRHALQQQRTDHPTQSSPSPCHVSPNGTAAGTLLEMINDDLSREALDDVKQSVEVVASGVGVVRRTLQDVASRNIGDSKLLTTLAGRVDEIRNSLQQQAAMSHVMHNERPAGTPDAGLAPVLQEINHKLGAVADASVAAEILDLVRAGDEHRSLQASQGVENARYLAELNSWLEAFVNHGSSHLQGISDAVNTITQEIGPLPVDETSDDLPTAARPTVLSSLQELISRSRAQEQENATRREELDALISAMHEEMRLNAEMRNACSSESVMEYMAKQQEEYGTMLRVVSDTLFDEIRGERLRFVDAMQEATAINVHRHVDDLKGELAREIATMTKRVAYLQRTSHEWEARIADLLTFYNKQGGPQSQSVQQTPVSQEPAPGGAVYPNCRLSRSARPLTFDQSQPLVIAVTCHQVTTLRQRLRAAALYLLRLAGFQDMTSEGYNLSSVSDYGEIGYG